MRRPVFQLEPRAFGVFLIVLSCVLGGCSSRSSIDSSEPPYEPGEALSTIEVADGFEVELFASEPLVADPVAMEIDEEGNLYVLENHGYPLDTGTSSRIKLLFDTNGDGRPDEAEVFADSLKMPTGLMRWKDGLIVTDAPHVLYFEDVDGDYRADVREIVLTGFSFSNPQHNISAPVYGLDNWIYIANEGSIGSDYWPEKFGGEGTEVHFPDRTEAPELPRNAGNQNVRFRPDSYQLETVSGRSQFGQAFDAWGRHFLGHNTNIIYRAEIESRYLERNPDLIVSDVLHTLSDEGPMPRVYPITEDPEFAIFSDVGVITSAGGLTLYLADLFPEDYQNVSFVGESAHNLVHASTVSRSGVTFTAHRIPEDKEFLASRDRWFRPVNFYIGPDGALYVLDYYREYIEHPEWLAEDLHDSDALYNGRNRGRIYRVVPEAAEVRPAWGAAVALGEAPAGELVEALAHPNIWWRRTAQRLLVDRNGGEAIEPLKRLVRENSSAVGRLHGLWTLEGLDELSSELIERGLTDAAPGVRENAIKLAEAHLDDDPSLEADLLEMGSDPDPRVQFQLLCTLGDLTSTESRELHGRLLFHHVDSPWMQIAGLTAVDLDALALFEAAAARLSGEETAGRRQFFHRVGALAAAQADRGQIAQLIEGILRPRSPDSVWWRAPSLEGAAEGLAQRERDERLLYRERVFMVDAVLNTEDDDLRGAYLNILDVLGLPMGPPTTRALDRAGALAIESGGDPELRVDALRLLGMADPAAYVDVFEQVVRAEEPTAIQRTAVENLAEVGGERVGRLLIDRWNRMTPPVRDAAMQAFMRADSRRSMLLDAVEAGTVAPSTIGWSYRVRLMRDSEDREIRRRARSLLKRRTAEREEIVSAYEEALELEGDVERGRQVFQNVCARCHAKGRVEGTGFGPDLSSVRNRSKRWMLTQILMPNTSIADNYEQWAIERESGGTLTGVISAETATSVTIMSVVGEETTVARSDISSMSAVGASAMPAGLENQIDYQQMADLLAFLKSAE